MSAKQLLDRIKQQGLLEDRVIKKLRQQIEGSSKTVSPQAVLKTLLDKGMLTKFQVKKLLEEIEDNAPATPTTPPAAEPPVDDLTLVSDEEEDLGLASLDDDPPATSAAADEDELVMLESADGGAAGLEELAELEPMEPGQELQPLGAAPDSAPSQGGLEPIEGGLEPMAELEPMEGSAGLESLHSDGDPLMDDMGGAQAAAPAAATQKKKGKGGYGQPKQNKFKSSQWDSKLMLLGGGGLALLLIAGIVLLFSLTRGSASEMFSKAEEEYGNQSYSQAIKLYTDFLDQFPSDPNASLARVKRGLAGLRQAVASRDMSSALKKAVSVLEEIRPEDSFREARPELAAILPQIAEGFSEQARDAEDPKIAEQAVAKAEQAMVLVSDPENIPSSLRPSIESRLESIEDNLKDANRNIARNDRLANAIGEINAAIATGETVKAYEIRKTLLREYPGLELNQQLRESVLKITQAERALVKVSTEPVSPQTEERQANRAEYIVLADRTEENAPQGVDNHVVLVLAHGAVYALDVSSGKVRWRRFVGFETSFHPVPLSKQIGADALIVDGRHNELLRVSVESGQLKWRLEIGEAFNDPVVAHGKVFVATDSGRLWEVDPETGISPRQVQFPMAFTVSPFFDSKRPKLFQVGEHSNVYVLALDTLQCDEVYYLGHKPGSVVATPIISVGHLFIPENSGGTNGFLHVLKADANGLKLEPAVRTKRLKGHVLVPPVLYGRRVMVVTDLGAVHVYDVEPANTKEPVSDAVKPLVATYPQPIIGYPLVEAGNVWIGGQHLAMYEIQFAQDKLVRKKIQFDKDVFVSPLQIIGDSLVSVRQRAGSAGVSVSAVDASDGQHQWQTDLAVPATLVIPREDGSGLLSVSGNGTVYELGKEQLAAHYQDVQAESLSNYKGNALTEAVAFGKRWALSGRQMQNQIVIFDPARSDMLSGFSLASHASADAKTTSRPVSFMGGLLVTMDNGQVLLLSPGSRGKVMPFQPRVQAGTKINWRRPAVTDDGKQFFITDGQKRMYRIEVKRDSQPRLEQSAFVDLKDEISSPLALVGNALYGVSSTPSGDAVVSFEVPDMSAGKRWDLEGRLMWGPERIGDVVLLATEKEGLICLEAGQQRRWVSPLKHGPLAGTPLVLGGDLLLTSKSGVVWKLNGQTGEETASFDVGEPLGAGAVLVSAKVFFPGEDGQRILLPGSDGVLHVIGQLGSGS